MAATTTSAATPATAPPSSGHHRSASHSRTRIPSRPATPLRPPSRTSLRASQTTPSGGAAGSATGANKHDPLASLEPAFAELSDSMADLEANFMHLHLLNESLGRFNDNFGAFLYGMNMSAFCVNFPEAPIPQSFARHKDTPSQLANSPFRERTAPPNAEAEATFLTTDTSFVENPPTSGKPASKYSAPPSAASLRPSMLPARGASARGRATGGTGRGGSLRGGTTGGSRVGSDMIRGAGRGRAGGLR